jgi:hypothetical protein
VMVSTRKEAASVVSRDGDGLGFGRAAIAQPLQPSKPLAPLKGA